METTYTSWEVVIATGWTRSIEFRTTIRLIDASGLTYHSISRGCFLLLEFHRIICILKDGHVKRHELTGQSFPFKFNQITCTHTLHGTFKLYATIYSMRRGY